VQLPPPTIAYLYQSGLDHIRQAYAAAAGALENAAREAKAASLDYASSGKDDSVYEFEDGHPVLISSTQHELDSARVEVAYSVRAIREAFVISSFHYWEKWARSITKQSGRNDTFDVLRRKMSINYEVHEQLCGLNHLTNLLKHGTGAAYHARQLATTRPDLFLRLPEGDDGWILKMTDETVQEAFAIISGSGPK